MQFLDEPSSLGATFRILVLEMASGLGLALFVGGARPSNRDDGYDDASLDTAKCVANCEVVDPRYSARGSSKNCQYSHFSAAALSRIRTNRLSSQSRFTIDHPDR